MHASMQTIDALNAGKTLLQWTVFDGVTSEREYYATDVVTGVPSPLETKPHGDVQLLDGKAWRVRTAFFHADNAEGTPFNESSYDGHENLVVNRLVMDLGLVVTTGKLVEIRALPEPDC